MRGSAGEVHVVQALHQRHNNTNIRKKKSTVVTAIERHHHVYSAQEIQKEHENEGCQCT